MGSCWIGREEVSYWNLPPLQNILLKLLFPFVSFLKEKPKNYSDTHRPKLAWSGWDGGGMMVTTSMGLLSLQNNAGGVCWIFRYPLPHALRQKT